MKRILVLVAGAAAPALGQFVPEWVNTHVSSSTTAPMAGAARANGESFAVFTRSIGLEDDIGLVKFAADGTVAWERIYAGPGGQDIAADVCLSADGAAVYVLGRSKTLNFGDSDFNILKYDADTGVLLWQRLWDAGDLKIESPQAIAAMPDGGVVATGAAGTTSFRLDYGTVRLDASGTVMWSREFRGSGRFLFDNDTASEVAVTPEGDVVVSGIASIFNGSEFRTIKYDGQTGEELWSVARSPANGARDLAIAPDGDAVLFGVDPLGIDRRWVVIRYDGATGAPVWDVALDPGFDEFASSMVVDEFGDVFVTGGTDPDGDDSNTNENMITAAFDGFSGALLWRDEFGDEGIGDRDLGVDLWLDGAGGLFVVGSTRSASLVSGPFHSDGIIRKIDAGTGQSLGLGLVDLTVPGGDPNSESFIEANFDSRGNALIFGISSGDVGVPTKVLMARYDGVGAALCDADLSGSSDPNDPAYGSPDGAVDAADFFYFLDQFVAGSFARADLTGSSDPNDETYGVPDGLIDAADFFYFLDLFVRGC